MAEWNLSLGSHYRTRELLRANDVNASRLFRKALIALASARKADPAAMSITVELDDVIAPSEWTDVELVDGSWVPVAGGGSRGESAAGDVDVA